MNVGAAGLRGSGVILDPQGAREDLKPWSQAKGAMLDDAVEGSAVASRLIDALGEKSQPGAVVKVRCGACRTLNDEDARFCDACGKRL